jgi:hypothetical protein
MAFVVAMGWGEWREDGRMVIDMGGLGIGLSYSYDDLRSLARRLLL